VKPSDGSCIWPEKGSSISRDRVRNLMRGMFTAIYQKPRYQRAVPIRKRFSLPGGLKEVNEVDSRWPQNITYIPITEGFLYLGGRL